MTTDRKTKNAIIERTMLGIEDHGILTCVLTLDYGGVLQGFGTYELDEYDESKKRRCGTAWGMEFVRRVLETLECESWEELRGKHCRAVADHCKVYRIGHIIKERWFEPEVDLKEFLV